MKEAAFPAEAGREPGTVLLVAACAGSRCRGLQRLPTADAAAGNALRAAVRDRAEAVLLSTGCLGICSRGSVALIGWAVLGERGRLAWTRSPVVLTLLDRPGRAAAAAEWVRHRAPEPDGLPDALSRPDVA